MMSHIEAAEQDPTATMQQLSQRQLDAAADECPVRIGQPHRRDRLPMRLSTGRPGGEVAGSGI
jgi:hypothetical protein